MRPLFAVLLGLMLLAGIGVLLWVGPERPAEREEGAAPVPEMPVGRLASEVGTPRAGEPRREPTGELAPTAAPDRPAPVDPVPPPAVPDGRGPLAGRVVLLDGSPLPGVTVRLDEFSTAVETDDAGRFRFEALPPGMQRLLVRSRVTHRVLGADTFATGDTDVELVVAAVVARVFGERAGGRVGIRRVRAARVRGDGSFVPLGGPVSSSSPVEHLDLVLPAGESVLVHAEDAEGVLAAFIETPPDGGRIGVVTRVGAGGLAGLRVTVGPSSPALEGAFARLRLEDTATGAVLEGRVPCGASAIWAGLVPGEYRVGVAIEPAVEANGVQDLALAAPEVALVLEENAETLLAVDAVPGGRIELVLPEAFQGAEVEPGPLAPCQVAVMPPGGGAALPLEWRDASADGVTAWVSDGPLPAGRWQVEVSTLHVVLWRGEAEVPAGSTVGVDTR